MLLWNGSARWIITWENPLNSKKNEFPNPPSLTCMTHQDPRELVVGYWQTQYIPSPEVGYTVTTCLAKLVKYHPSEFFFDFGNLLPNPNFFRKTTPCVSCSYCKTWAPMLSLPRRVQEIERSMLPTWRWRHMSSDQNLGCLGYIRDYTAQSYGDYNKPL